MQDLVDGDLFTVPSTDLKGFNKWQRCAGMIGKAQTLKTPGLASMITTACC